MKDQKSIHIKNMVCNRCIMVVDQIFQQAGLETASISLGEVKLAADSVSADKLSALDSLLLKHGFERIDDRKSQLLEQIKAAVIDAIHHHENFEVNINWSHYLSDKLNYDYNYLSSLFSSVTGITLEQYIIRQKVEKVKEFLFYDELSVKEIAYKLGYSSVAHLSSQFKKITGLTPTEFKESRQTDIRTPLDNII
ncbi:AraC family transcriptional regulator [Imperialibacter roseus]|uniref:AraC family transcriptional regulator n=1 Tax=Imperialibacter roseus TaxID=1324217 RepID=A0ABZ0IXY5_9BACT|nr:AraC family transcriptional regulator [Imperialibacter roseus]WOK08512.1 AraC family transcriptional regulator [Imperialibacter roseus]|tara:strand:- start:10916 stop:11500 length:585 start_codon:yes stop_codon:yes gene_type:complete